MEEFKENYSKAKGKLKKKKNVSTALQKLHLKNQTDEEDTTRLQKLIYRIKQLPIDAKVEIILSDLDEDLLNRLVVIPIGLFHRNYHKDIELADEAEFESHLLQLKINREGIYDALPEALTHQPIKHKKGAKDKEEILTEIRIQKEREKAARKFFLPIEQEIYRTRIILELEEVKYFINQRNISEHKVFQDFWEIPPFLNYHQISNMVYLLPIAQRIVGNFKLTELCFESILQNPINIKNTFPIKHKIPTIYNEATQQEDEMGVSLGAGILGEDFILSAPYYQEAIPAILINIGPITFEEADLYAKSTVEGFADGQKREVLEYLIKNFMTFEADTVINIDIKVAKGHYFKLSDEATTSNALLGMNVTL